MSERAMGRSGKYYEAGEGRARRVEDLFSRIAPRYDLINDLQSLGLHRRWKRRLVRLADVPDGGRALDLCCGTGDIVRGLAGTYRKSALVVGLDFALPMLRNAAATRTRFAAAGVRLADSPAGRGGGASQQGGPAVVYLRADALRIPARDASFDRVTISYGLRNVADLRGCLAEVLRVLRPGGRFLILDFGKPARPLTARIYFAYLRLVVPLFGRIFFSDPDTHGYILDSLLHFPSQAELAGILRGAGFARVRVENPLLGTMGLVVAEKPD